MSMDARIQQSVVATLAGRPEPVEAGPFLIGYDPTTTSSHINYATPIPGKTVTAAGVSALVDAFARINRKPRLEYVVSAAPTLENLLLQAGFTVEERHDYLICLPETLVRAATPDGFTLRVPETDEDRAALVAAQNEVFGGEPVATEADVARMARTQARGGHALMAVTDSGRCAGGGAAMPPGSGVSEVAGIAVREEFRRRGLAAAVTSGTTERLFAAGADLAWLEASGPDAARIYGRAGYRPAGKRLYISR